MRMTIGFGLVLLTSSPAWAEGGEKHKTQTAQNTKNKMWNFFILGYANSPPFKGGGGGGWIDFILNKLNQPNPSRPPRFGRGGVKSGLI